MCSGDLLKSHILFSVVGEGSLNLAPPQDYERNKRVGKEVQELCIKALKEVKLPPGYSINFMPGTLAVTTEVIQ